MRVPSSGLLGNVVPPRRRLPLPLPRQEKGSASPAGLCGGICLKTTPILLLKSLAPSLTRFQSTSPRSFADKSSRERRSLPSQQEQGGDDVPQPQMAAQPSPLRNPSRWQGAGSTPKVPVQRSAKTQLCIYISWCWAQS